MGSSCSVWSNNHLKYEPAVCPWEGIPRNTLRELEPEWGRLPGVAERRGLGGRLLLPRRLGLHLLLLLRGKGGGQCPHPPIARPRPGITRLLRNRT